MFAGIQHNPWRAPGSAPTADACGLAGGTPFLQEGTEAGDYSTTKYAHHGTYGTTLPPMDTGVKWKIGGTAEVTWQVLNNRKHCRDSLPPAYCPNPLCSLA